MFIFIIICYVHIYIIGSWLRRQDEIHAFWREVGVRGGSGDPCFKIDWKAAGKAHVALDCPWLLV